MMLTNIFSWVGKYKQGLDVFRKGQVVANPEAWKNGQITAGAITALLVAVLQFTALFGFKVDVDVATLDHISLGILGAYGLYNAIVTTISSRKVGLPAKDTSGGQPTPNVPPGFLGGS